MQPSTPFVPPFGPEIGFAILSVIAVVVVWSVIIKGFALWHAARDGQKWWFIAMLIVNTVGILEVVYLVWFRQTSALEAPEVSSPAES